MPAMREVPNSIGEGFEAARLAAGYKRIDDVVTALDGKISRDFVYQIERIGNRPNAANPTLSVMITLANLYGVDLGDCFPSARVSSGEVAEVFDALADIPPQDRRDAVRALAMLAKSLGRRVTDDDVQIGRARRKKAKGKTA